MNHWQPVWTLLLLLFLAGCQKAPSVVGQWLGQHDEDVIHLQINHDGTCVGGEQSSSGKTRKPMDGVWIQNDNGTIALDFDGRHFVAELVSDNQLVMRRATIDEQITMRRLAESD